MKTNRRGFFGALAGLAGGVYAAFQGEATKVVTKPVDVTTMADKPKPTKTAYIHLTGAASGSTDYTGNFSYTVYGYKENGEAVPVAMNDGNKSYSIVPI